MKVRETAIKFVHRIVRESKPNPEDVYDEATLAAYGYEASLKETQTETIRRLEDAEDLYDQFRQHDAWYGGGQ